MSMKLRAEGSEEERLSPLGRPMIAAERDERVGVSISSGGEGRAVPGTDMLPEDGSASEAGIVFEEVGSWNDIRCRGDGEATIEEEVEALDVWRQGPSGR